MLEPSVLMAGCVAVRGQGAVLAIASEMWKGNDVSELVMEGYQG